MNAIWQRILAWLESKGGAAHVFAGAYVFLVAAYASLPQFHDLVITIHKSLPSWVQELLTTALGLWAFYKTWGASTTTKTTTLTETVTIPPAPVV